MRRANRAVVGEDFQHAQRQHHRGRQRQRKQETRFGTESACAKKGVAGGIFHGAKAAAQRGEVKGAQP